MVSFSFWGVCHLVQHLIPATGWMSLFSTRYSSLHREPKMSIISPVFAEIFEKKDIKLYCAVTLLKYLSYTGLLQTTCSWDFIKWQRIKTWLSSNRIWSPAHLNFLVYSIFNLRILSRLLCRGPSNQGPSKYPFKNFNPSVGRHARDLDHDYLYNREGSESVNQFSVSSKV